MNDETMKLILLEISLFTFFADFSVVDAIWKDCTLLTALPTEANPINLAPLRIF